MKNYIIGFLLVCMIVMGTFWYKDTNGPVLRRFPIDGALVEPKDNEPPLYLFIFFTKSNCPVCLETIQVLNTLTPPFKVTGIIPPEELEQEKDFRRLTGATFELKPYTNRYRRFYPNYAPIIYGVSGGGKVLFALPGVPEQADYLNNFLVNFYGKSMEKLMDH